MRQKCDCHCYVEYPNECHKHKNGKWKCVDKYEPIRDWIRNWEYAPITHCRKKILQSDTDDDSDYEFEIQAARKGEE